MSLEDNLCIALFVLFIAGFGFMCGYDCGKYTAKE